MPQRLLNKSVLLLNEMGVCCCQTIPGDSRTAPELSSLPTYHNKAKQNKVHLIDQSTCEINIQCPQDKVQTASSYHLDDMIFVQLGLNRIQSQSSPSRQSAWSKLQLESWLRGGKYASLDHTIIIGKDTRDDATI